MSINRDTEIIDATTTKKSGTSKGNLNHTTTNFHTVCVNPHNALGGIHDSEILALHNQAVKDHNLGWLICGTLGVEGTKCQRHGHLRHVIETPSETHVTKERYEPLIDSKRQVHLDKSGKKNITVHCSQPNKGERKHLRAFTHLAYPWKYMAQGYDTLNDFIQYFLEWDTKDTPKYRSYGLFDNGMNDEDKTCFATAIWNHWLKEKDKVIPIFIRWSDEEYNQVAMEFLQENGMPVDKWQPTPEAQALVIAAMYFHTGEKQYLLTYFFKRNPKLHGKIIVKKESSDIEAIVYSAVCKELADVHDVKLVQLVPTKITSERVKELEEELKKCKVASQKKELKLEECLKKFYAYRGKTRKRKRDEEMEQCDGCGLTTHGPYTSSICHKHWEDDSEELERYYDGFSSD